MSWKLVCLLLNVRYLCLAESLHQLTFGFCIIHTDLSFERRKRDEVFHCIFRTFRCFGVDCGSWHCGEKHNLCGWDQSSRDVFKWSWAGSRLVCNRETCNFPFAIHCEPRFISLISSISSRSEGRWCLQNVDAENERVHYWKSLKQNCRLKKTFCEWFQDSLPIHWCSKNIFLFFNYCKLFKLLKKL